MRRLTLVLILSSCIFSSFSQNIDVQQLQDAAAQLFHKKALTYLKSGVPADWTGVEVMQVK